LWGGWVACFHCPFNQSAESIRRKRRPAPPFPPLHCSAQAISKLRQLAYLIFDNSKMPLSSFNHFSARAMPALTHLKDVSNLFQGGA